MKTNEEILMIFHLMNEVVRVSTPEEMKPFSYAFIKNRVKFKPVIEQRDEFVKQALEEIKTDDPEKIQEALKALEKTEEFQTFLKDDSGIELYTITLDSLEGKHFNLLAVDSLIDTIVTT